MINTNSALQMAMDLLDKGFSRLDARQFLLKNGYDESDAEIFTSQAYKAHHLKRRKLGVVLGLMGCALLATGFFLTLFIFQLDQSVDNALYGMNSAGAILLMAGMTILLGW